MLTPLQLLNKLRLRKKLKPKTAEEIKKAKADYLEEAYIKSTRLGALIYKTPGWLDYVAIMEEFIERCQIKKLEINHSEIMMLPTDQRDKALKELMLLDEDILILRKMIQAPNRYIHRLENKKEEEKPNND